MFHWNLFALWYAINTLTTVMTVFFGLKMSILKSNFHMKKNVLLFMAETMFFMFYFHSVNIYS